MTSELPVILQHWETGLQLDQRERKRFRIGTHNDEPAVQPQTLNAVHHGFGRVGSTENDVGTARCREALSVADNLIRAQSANHFVFIGGVRNRDGLEARGLRVLHRQVTKPADSKFRSLKPLIGSRQSKTR